MNRSVPESLLICILVLCLALTPIGVRGETEDSGKAQQLIEAPGAVLMEKETGTVIYSRDPDTRRSPASITKIMTLILIFDAIREGTLHLEDSITTSAYARSMGGSQVFLEEGEKQTAETMIKCIVIASGNDASVAMAEYISGTEEAFVEEMNKRAEGLGMTNTHFSDCCGLTEDPDHLTTARDIALMTRELINCYPEIHNYSTIWMENITHVTKQGTREFGLSNTNRLLKMATNFRVTGLKTGSTGKAKFCVSATGRKGDIDLIAVIMAADDSKARVRDAITLLNYGFGKCQKYTEKEQKKISPVEVRGGTEKEVKVRQKSTFTYVDTTGADLSKIKSKTRKDKNVKAPLKKGEKVGETVYYLDRKKIGARDIVTTEKVEKQNYGSALENVLEEYFGI